MLLNQPGTRGTAGASALLGSSRPGGLQGQRPHNAAAQRLYTRILQPPPGVQGPWPGVASRPRVQLSTLCVPPPLGPSVSGLVTATVPRTGSGRKHQGTEGSCWKSSTRRRTPGG